MIIIDKFEEIYQKNQGFKFLRCLLSNIKWLKEKSHPNRIVFLAITTSEGHSKTTDFPDYAELSDPSANIQLTGLTRKEMRQVIEKPANKKGVQFEEGLVDTILRDAGQEPRMLPLLEVALRRLWSQRTGNLIKKDTYIKIGGIRSALAKYANDCIAGLENKNYQEIAKDIFLQIIDAREDLISTEKISSRAIREEDLIVKENAKLVVDLLVEKRLLIRGSQDSKQVLKIPHDLLIEYWPQINDWLNQDTRNRIFINDLGKRAGEWQKSGRKVSGLDSGPMLELTEEFLNKNSNDFRLTDLMKEFHEKGKINNRNNENKKQKIKIIFLALPWLLFFGLAGFYWVYKDQVTTRENTHKQLISAVEGKYLSSGGRTHFVPPNQEKRLGNEHFNKKEYEKAEQLFNDSRINSLDDPEALIYSNNAKAFFSNNYLTIVASVPVKYSNDIAKEMLRGIAQAQNEINSRGGIRGKLLHIVIADDNNDPADVDVIANYLINDDNGKEVLAVIGSNVSEATMQAANIYQGKMVMISPTSFAVNFDKIKKPKNGKNYIFFVVNDSKAVMPKLVKRIRDTITHPRLLVCDDSKAYDQARFRELFEENELIHKKGKRESRCDLNNKKDSYEKIVEKAVQSGINSLFIAPHVSRINDGINLARYARVRNPDLKLFGSPTLYNATTLMNGEVTTGLVIPAHWHPDVFQKHHFYQEAKKLWGEQSINGITWRTASSYDAVYVISTALEKVNINYGLNRENLQQQLENKDFKYEGALDEISFDENGTRKKSDSFLIEVKSCPKDCLNGYKYGFYQVN